MISAGTPVELRPRLTLRVGVTGHRPSRLDVGAQGRVAETSESILSLLVRAVEKVRSLDVGVFSSEPPDVRLVSALAEGADTILANAARALGLRLDIILPFERSAYVSAQGMQAEALAAFDDALSTAHRVLELDGDSHEAAPEGYLAAGRRMLAHIDILIAVWDGTPAAGVGGTAQVVFEAVVSGIPVIWINIDGDAALVTEAAQLSDLAKGEAVKMFGAFHSEVLSETVAALLSPPGPDTEARARLERFLRTPTPAGSFWSIYDLLRSVALKRKFNFRVQYDPDAETESAWKRFQNRAEDIGGASFSDALSSKLQARWRHADAVALHCSHAYRSTYIANFCLAGFAVTTGLTSVFWWNHVNSIVIKSGFVIAEITIIGLILWLTKYGGQARCDWHARWLESRAVAELLRPARLPALIGDTVAPQHRYRSEEVPDAWVEWYVRATLREIGPPTGVLDAAALRAAIDAALQEEIEGQIKYNESAVRATHDLDRWLHIWGERLFMATFFTGIIYVIVAVAALSGLVQLSDNWKQLVKAATTVVGGGFPALGAALFGIRATGDFKVAGEQAERTGRELKLLKEALEREKAAPSRERVSRSLASLTQVLATDMKDWAKVYRLRELTLPG